MSESEVVLTEMRDGIRVITLNRPEKLNAVNQALIEQLLEATRAANADEDTRAVVLHGAGRAFCAGYDLSTHNPDKTWQEERIIIDKIQAITREVVLGNKIVIGAIQGWAVGAGLEMVWTPPSPRGRRSGRAGEEWTLTGRRHHQCLRWKS